MCLRARLTGNGVDDVLITKCINVQQNPGRGAKVVRPKVPFPQFRVGSATVGSGQRLIKLKTRFMLGKLSLIYLPETI